VERSAEARVSLRLPYSRKPATLRLAPELQKVFSRPSPLDQAGMKKSRGFQNADLSLRLVRLLSYWKNLQVRPSVTICSSETWR